MRWTRSLDIPTRPSRLSLWARGSLDRARPHVPTTPLFEMNRKNRWPVSRWTHGPIFRATAGIQLKSNRREMERVDGSSARRNFGQSRFQIWMSDWTSEIQLSAATLKGDQRGPEDRGRFILKDLLPFFVRVPSRLYASAHEWSIHVDFKSPLPKLFLKYLSREFFIFRHRSCAWTV